MSMWPLLKSRLHLERFSGSHMEMIVCLLWVTALVASLYSPLSALAQARMHLRDNAGCILLGAITGVGCVFGLLLKFGPPLSTAGVALGEIVILGSLCVYYFFLGREGHGMPAALNASIGSCAAWGEPRREP